MPASTDRRVPPVAERPSRDFELGFSAALEDYKKGQLEKPVHHNTRVSVPYAHGYQYGWLEAQAKRMGCRTRPNGQIVCRD